MKNRPRISRSLELYERIQQVVPGGTQLISRRPQIFAPGVAPIFAERAKGSHVWDVDGGEYLDYGMSVSACILGYADDVVDDAVREQIGRGVMTSLNHPAELELAELLCRTIPCAEMVRFAKGGGEACAIAVRIARGTTGRDKVLFCGYHGWHDWYLAANLNAADSLDAHLLPGIEPMGVPRALAGTAIPFPYGDLPALQRALDLHAGQVACVIMEPLRSTEPSAGYLDGVRQLTRDHNVILIFDEVTTGFRHAAGGIEEFLGVVPDMATFAKSLSNGYAMGAVVGRRAVMEPAARMFISSTNWSDLVGVVAALTTLREIRRRDVPAKLLDFGQRLMTEWNQIARERGVPARMHGMPQWPLIEFTPDEQTGPKPANDRRESVLSGDVTLARKLGALYAQEMAKRYVLCNTHPVHSAAHDDRDLDRTLTATREALQTVRDALHAGRVDELLEVSLAPPIFRRLVQ